jgi:uncharacterized membrane protein YfcA
MGFTVLVFVASFAAGSIASVAGFGIGSVLTPLLAIRLGMRTAVAAVSVAHLAGTALRFWLLRQHVDRRVLVTFGVASGVGGLAGALFQARASNAILTLLLAALLLFAGLSELFGIVRAIHLGRRGAWVVGALSGLFGGLVGNQGGIRSAGLLAFDVDKTSFVATATAIALIVDGVRMPVYAVTAGSDLLAAWPLMLVATAGVLAGTIAGGRALRRIPDRIFRRIVAVLLLALAAWLSARAWSLPFR